MFLKTHVERTKKTEFGSFAMSLERVSDMYQIAVEDTCRDKFPYFSEFSNILLKVESCK